MDKIPSTTLLSGLKSIPDSIASGYGLTITDQCKGHINTMIVEAVEEITNEGNIHEVSVELVQKTQEDLTRLISHMAQDAISNSSAQIQETNYYNIRNIFCPLPPWIKPPC